MKKILSVLMIGSILISCKKDDLPTEDIAKQEVEKTIKLESKDKVALLEFKKIDALKERAFETDYYTVGFEGKTVYKQDGYSLVYEDYDSNKGFLLVLDKKPLSLFSSDYYGEVKKGEEKRVNGYVRFIKSEKGWSASHIKIRNLDKLK